MAVTINGDGLIQVDGTSTTQGRVRLAEDTDNGTNYIELTAPASVASNRTVTFPDATTTVVGTDATQTLTNKTLTSPTITGASMSSMASSVITSGTAQASTSGTSIDFTGIPSWAKRITVMFDGVSTNGTVPYQIQLGTSGGFDIASYVSWSGIVNTSSAANANGSTTGFIVSVINAVADTQTGSVQITNITGNTWVSSGLIARDGAIDGVVMSAGSKTLSAALTQLRVISSATGSPSGTFDAGTINILYE